MDAPGKTGLEKTVVLKHGRYGYGFDLSKETPVFVLHVNPSSSAEKAGINPGDRLMKVNGVDVVNMKVAKVEDMIQECSHISLTLLGKLTQNGTKAKETVEISPPKQMQELTLQTMRTMLQKQRKAYETLSVNYCKAPSDKLGRDIRECESLIKLLESEIASKSPPIDAHIRTTAASIHALRDSRYPQSPTVTAVVGGGVKKMGDDVDIPSSAHSSRMIPGSPTKGSFKGRSTKRAATFHNGSISPSKRRHNRLGFLGGGGSSGNVVDGYDLSDDEDLSDAVDGASEAGPFGSLQELRNNPAHMSVFIHYLNTNKNPNNLLFYLVALSYQNHCKAADRRQRGSDIFWTFFTEQAPLPIEVNSTIKSRAQHTLEVEESENHLRSVFVETRESLSESIIADLADYRHKRVMGLAGMYGDHMLSNNMAIAKQIEVVNSILIPDIKAKNDDTHCANVTEAGRSHAIAVCLATIVLDSCGKSGVAKAISSPPLDKIQTFTRGDVVLRKGRGSKKKTTISKHGHTLHLETYARPALCDMCSKQLWGVIYHGYQCSECKMNIHRYYCLSQLEQPCLGKNPGFMSTSRRRRPSLHANKKTQLSAILSGSTQTESTDTTDVTTRLDIECGRKSPILEAGSLESKDGEYMEGEDRLTSKPRSISDPKHMLLVHSASVMPNDTSEQPKRESMKVSRTQSAKYDSRQDHMDSLHPNLSMSASDDSLIGPKLDSIVEGGSLSDEDIKELIDNDIEEEPLPWALSVKREVVQSLRPYEVQRQEYIKELVYTERTHLHKLKTMKFVYKVPMTKESVLTQEQVDLLFPSLEELILYHTDLCTELKEHTADTTNGVVKAIADVLLQRFDGAAGEKLRHACSISASSQVNAEHLFKDWRRKNEKFKIFIRNAELHPVCRRHRLTLTELLPIPWQRLTRYQLLVKNILSSYKKHWEELNDSDKEEAQKIETALTCIKDILQYVNQQLHLAQNRQRLLAYQSKLDTSALERTTNPIAQQFKLLDLTAERRKLLHEGPLTWKVQSRKLIELYALLLTDILVLMEKHDEREKYYLPCYHVESIGGTKEELSPVIRLQDCLLRSAAADKGGRTFLIVNNSSLMKLAQMYEFTAESPQEKKRWEEAIKRAMMGTQDILYPEHPISPGNSDLPVTPLTSSMHGASQDYMYIREKLNKIDEDIKKLLNDKLRILQSMQGASVTLTRTRDKIKEDENEAIGDPKEYVAVAIEQAGEVASTLSHVMVTNPTKTILTKTQSRLADIIAETQRNLSKLMLSLGNTENRSDSFPSNNAEESSLESGRIDDKEKVKEDKTKEDDTEGDDSDKLQSEEGGIEVGQDEEDGDIEDSDGVFEDESNMDVGTRTGLIGAHHTHHNMCISPEFLPPADLVSLTSQDGVMLVKGDDELSSIIDPPDNFCGDDSATPTPQLETGSMASGTITPRISPSGAISPLSPKPHADTKGLMPTTEVVKKQPETLSSEPSTTTQISSGKEHIVTVTGGPSPRLMRIIASSYKSKDSSTNSTTTTAATNGTTTTNTPANSTATGATKTTSTANGSSIYPKSSKPVPAPRTTPKLPPKVPPKPKSHSTSVPKDNSHGSSREGVVVRLKQSSEGTDK